MLVLLAVLPAPASANAGSKIIERCAYGESIAGFSEKAYRQALQEMPTEVAEYQAECVELISEAERAAAGHHSASKKSGNGGAPETGGNGTVAGTEPGSGSTGAGQPPITITPADQQALAEATRSGSSAVPLGARSEASGTDRAPSGSATAEPVLPGVVHANLASAADTIPDPLLAAIALIAALTIAGAGYALWMRFGRSAGEGGALGRRLWGGRSRLGDGAPQTDEHDTGGR